MTPSSYYDVFQVYPRLSDELCLPVFVEYRKLQLEVVRRLVDNESELLVPSWCLATSSICLCLLCFLPESRCAIWVLLAHSLSIWQVPGPVDDDDQVADDRTIDSHIGEDARGVRRPAVGLKHLCRSHD